MDAQSISALLEHLSAIVGTAHVHVDDEARGWLREWRGAFSPSALAVVRPNSTDEVAAVLRCCGERSIDVVPQSGNTGLVGGAAADASQRQIVLNLERLARVREIDADNATMTVEAGCTLADAQRAARAAGFYLPIMLVSREQCRIGGNLATNAGGLNVIQYGNTRDRVRGLEVVLADGRIWRDLSGLRKDNSGYDLKNLFVGSEGTLGVITAAVLELADPPRQRAVALFALKEPAQAVALQRSLRAASGGLVVGCELMCDNIVQLALRHIDTARLPFDEASPWYLLVELASAASGGWLAPILHACANDALADGLAHRVVCEASDAGMAVLWALREALPPAQVAEGASIKHDISLPLSRLSRFIDQAWADVLARVPGIRPCPFGHVGDGNLHFNLTRPVAMTDAEFRGYAPALHRLIHDRVAAMGGSIAAEHGVGRLKVDEIVRLKSPVEIDLMRAIKTALDPYCRLNPGAVLRSNTTYDE